MRGVSCESTAGVRGRLLFSPGIYACELAIRDYGSVPFTGLSNVAVRPLKPENVKKPRERG